MGWHRDDEAELGEQPVVASLSLGATRRFLIKPVSRAVSESRRPGFPTRRAEDPGAGTRVAIELAHGSLLVMRGSTQHLYRHALPRTRKPIGPRVNLTFRLVAR